MENKSINLLSNEKNLRSFILSIYRELLIKSESGSLKRKTILNRFIELKNKKSYYWLSQIEL